MESEKSKIEETVKDVQDLREVLKERHSENVSLSIRLDSALGAIVGSLGMTMGAQVPGRFKPSPLIKLSGNIVGNTKNLDMEKLMQDADIKAFVDNTNATYDGFLGRDNHDILEGVDEETVRGVAKMAGISDFDEAKYDTQFVTAIKEAIQNKNKTETARLAELAKIDAEKGGYDSKETVDKVKNALEGSDFKVLEDEETQRAMKVTDARLKQIAELDAEDQDGEIFIGGNSYGMIDELIELDEAEFSEFLFDATNAHKKSLEAKEPAPELTVAELTALKKAATEDYTKLFNEAPDKKLSGASIRKLIDAELAKGK